MEVTGKTLIWSLSTLLMASSLLKSVNMHSFASETLQYMEAYMPSICTPYYKEAAVALCALELLTALLLKSGRLSMVASCASVLLFTFFVWLTGINLFFPSMFGSIESCGCFGEIIHFSPTAAFAKSIVIWGMSVALLAIQAYGSKTQKVWQNAIVPYLSVCLIASILPSAYSLLLMTKIDMEFYIAGYMAICAATISLAILNTTRRKYH